MAMQYAEDRNNLRTAANGRFNRINNNIGET
jgi:hypothetical protein